MDETIINGRVAKLGDRLYNFLYKIYQHKIDKYQELLKLTVKCGTAVHGLVLLRMAR